MGVYHGCQLKKPLSSAETLYPLSTWQTSHKINQPRVTQQAGAFPLTPVLLPAFPAGAGSPLPAFGEPFPEPQPLVPLQVAAGEATTTSPPVKPDAGRLEAVVGVVVDELCVHGGVPHHLLAQSQAPLSAPAPGRARCARQAGEVSGKPQTPWGPRGLSQQVPGLCMKATWLPLPPEQPFTHGVINLGCAGFMPPGFYPSCTCALLPDALPLPGPAHRTRVWVLWLLNTFQALLPPRALLPASCAPAIPGISLREKPQAQGAVPGPTTNPGQVTHYK